MHGSPGLAYKRLEQENNHFYQKNCIFNGTWRH